MAQPAPLPEPDDAAVRATAAAASAAPFLAGDGEMAARMRAFDWATTPLGAPAQWRPSLKAMVRMMLTTRHPVFIFWGPHGICLYNDAYSASIGPEKHPSILGARAQDAWPEIWHIIGPQIELVMQGRGSTWHENQLVPIMRHGRLADVYWTYSYGPIDDEQAPNGIGGVLVLCTETTAQVQASRRLALERERLAALFEQAPTFMVILRGPEHVVELANPSYLQLIGDRSVIGRRVADALPEAVAQGFGALLDEVYRSGRPYRATGSRFIVQAEPGGPTIERFLDFVYQPIVDSRGAVEGIFVVGVDVSERHGAERALRLSQERLRMAVESSNLGSFDVDLARGRVRLSETARELFGFAEADADLEACFARLHPDDRARVEELVQRAVRGEGDGSLRSHHRLLHTSGALRWIDLSGRVLDDADGKRLIGVMWDVSEQQRLLEALRQADRRKDEFLATLAHELRNPLAVVRTAAHLLSRPQLGAEQLQRAGEMIQRQSRTMAALLDDLLDVSRITSGKLELKPAPVTLQAVVDAAMETARPLLDGRRHQLEVELSTPQQRFVADPIRVEQILGNLLSTAAKYTDPGGRIVLRARADVDAVEFVVEDNGIGVAPQTMPTLFEMFHQAPGVLGRAQGGLGIGLALTRGLVELHGGRIEGSSEGLGKGSRFVVRLPLGQPAAGADAIDGGAQAPQATARRLRVLVVDENVDAAQALAAVLEAEGYPVRVRHDGASALALASEAEPPDVCLLDIGMPGMDGYELARQLRALPAGPRLWLIATTGFGQGADKERAHAAGFDLHLTKPIDPQAVLLLLGKRAGRELSSPPALPQA